MPADSQALRKRTPSTSTRSTSSRSSSTFGPPRSISDFNCSRCSDRSWPLRRMRAPRLSEIRSIFSILNVGPNYVSDKCNRWTVRNSPQQRNLALPPAGNFQEFLIYEESAAPLAAAWRNAGAADSVGRRKFESVFVDFQTLDLGVEGPRGQTESRRRPGGSRDSAAAFAHRGCNHFFLLSNVR